MPWSGGNLLYEVVKIHHGEGKIRHGWSKVRYAICKVKNAVSFYLNINTCFIESKLRIPEF